MRTHRILMAAFLQSHTLHILLAAIIGSVWVVFGLYCKILNRVPRHRKIVERVLGPRFGGLILVIGIGEVLLGLWVFSGWERLACAGVLTAAIAGMNTLEIWLARDLLFSVRAMVCLNAILIGLIWWWALAPVTP
jgi:hypothetical protein